MLLKWLINAIAILLVGHFLSGVVVANMYTAFVVALVLAILNVTIKPLLLLLTLPINLLSLGFFTLIINGLLFWFVSSVVKGFTVVGFWPAFLGALLFSIISTIANHLLD